MSRQKKSVSEKLRALPLLMAQLIAHFSLSSDHETASEELKDRFEDNKDAFEDYLSIHGFVTGIVKMVDEIGEPCWQGWVGYCGQILYTGVERDTEGLARTDALFSAGTTIERLLSNALQDGTFVLGDVKNMAEFLIEQNGSTTTLEVKTALRDLGFKAVQKDISEGMAALKDVNPDWKVTDTGTHKIYTVDDSPTPAATPTLSLVANTGKISSKDPAYRNRIGDWRVSDAKGRAPVEITRNMGNQDAKKTYAKAHRVPYFDVRIQKA